MRNRTIGLFVFIVVIALILPLQALAAGAKETVETEVNKVLATLSDPAFKDRSRDEKIAEIREIIGRVFDYRELSKRTVGRAWKKMNDAQKNEFVELFSELLGNVYADRLLAYSNEKVEFTKETELKKGRVEVESNIQLGGGKTAPLNYRMIQKDGKWKAYDIVIEGISMVKNYRSQFRPILSKGGPEELLKVLRKKVKS